MTKLKYCLYYTYLAHLILAKTSPWEEYYPCFFKEGDINKTINDNAGPVVQAHDLITLGVLLFARHQTAAFT
jgi:hypothetical protein